MTHKIKVLDKIVAEQIAAGEVVEKPASAVKELVENSIDAGATRIDVEIRDGGRNRIRVSDNGSGMNPLDAVLAFERHSTSKIREFEDIYKVLSMGFRGEALASICAVSRVEMVTREKDATFGTRVIFEGGEFIESEETGCPEGTSILVEKLFYNVPARRKFLSSPFSEQGAINKILMRMALASPEIFFTFSNEKKQLLSYPPVKTSLLRVEQIYGKEVEGRLLEVEKSLPEISLYGLISHPSLSFANRSRIFIFVNRRFVRSNLLYKAIQDPFQNLIPARKFPVAILFINIPPSLIDVNIHPTKEDIKFVRQSEVFSLIMKSIKESLHNTSSTGITFQKKPERTFIGPSYEKKKGEQTLPGFLPPFPEIISREKVFSSEPPEPLYSFLKEEKEFYPLEEKEEIQPVADKAVTSEEPVTQKREEPSEAERVGKKEVSGSFSQATVLGNFRNTYIIAKTEGELLLIDQHIAHERINFEMLQKSLVRCNTPSQSLLLPVTLDFPPHEAHWLRRNLSLFTGLGFDLEDFGENTFLLRGIPLGLDRLKEEKFFKEIIFECVLSERKLSYQDLFRGITAEIACKASIKAGDKLSVKEMEKLL